MTTALNELITALEHMAQIASIKFYHAIAAIHELELSNKQMYKCRRKEKLRHTKQCRPAELQTSFHISREVFTNEEIIHEPKKNRTKYHWSDFLALGRILQFRPNWTIYMKVLSWAESSKLPPEKFHPDFEKNAQNRHFGMTFIFNYSKFVLTATSIFKTVSSLSSVYIHCWRLKANVRYYMVRDFYSFLERLEQTKRTYCALKRLESFGAMLTIYNIRIWMSSDGIVSGWGLHSCKLAEVWNRIWGGPVAHGSDGNSAPCQISQRMSWAYRQTKQLPSTEDVKGVDVLTYSFQLPERS